MPSEILILCPVLQRFQEALPFTFSSNTSDPAFLWAAALCHIQLPPGTYF